MVISIKIYIKLKPFYSNKKENTMGLLKRKIQENWKKINVWHAKFGLCFASSHQNKFKLFHNRLLSLLSLLRSASWNKWVLEVIISSSYSVQPAKTCLLGLTFYLIIFTTIRENASWLTGKAKRTAGTGGDRKTTKSAGLNADSLYRMENWFAVGYW